MMQILLQMVKDTKVVAVFIKSDGHDGPDQIQSLFWFLQQMANIHDRQMTEFLVNETFMINLMRLVLYSAYHMDYYDERGNLLDMHDVYLDAPLEQDYANRKLDYGHLTKSLGNVFEVLQHNAEVASSENVDGEIVEEIVATIGAMRPNEASLPTLQMSLVTHPNMISDEEEQK